LNFVELCRKIISYDSSPASGTWEAVQWISTLAQSRGLHVEIIEEAYNDQRQANILIRPKNNRPEVELLLQAHLDTPDPGPFGLWTNTGNNPYDAHIIENRIYGLGAADVKLDFLCKLEALSSFDKETTWRLPPVLVGTFGEELGMSGALKLVRKNKFTAKMALISEPSNLRLITAGNGIATVEIRVPFTEQERKYREEHNLRESTSTQSRIFGGKAAHSSTPHLGDSSIKKMFEYLMQMPQDLIVMEMDGGVNFNTVPANAFLEVDSYNGLKDSIGKKLVSIYRSIKDLETQFLAYQHNPPTLNIGVVRTFEDHIFISGSCRVPPNLGTDVYELWMQKLKISCEITGGQFRISDYKRPYSTDESSPFVKACLSEMKEMGLSVDTHSQSSTNEASIWSRIGIQCVSFGPGEREGNIHTPREQVNIDDLKKAIEFYQRVIERFCL
jgi:acetylornithine deacetylase/succinyl-diaminopimelate desuccinylase-like protein